MCKGMILDEAKNLIAQKYGHLSWYNWIHDIGKITGNRYIPERFHEEAAELYARSKWDEACEAQKLATEIKPELKQRITEKFNEEFIHVSDVAYLIQSAPKPEFKP